MKIAIIGAGLMGRLIALSLLRENKQSNQRFEITLFDKDKTNAHNSAAYAAAGLLTPLGESLHCEANIVEMGFAAIKCWPDLLNSLDEYTIFQQAGAIMVSHEQDKGDYQRFVRHLANNYPQHSVQSLNRQQLLALEPELGRSFNHGLFLPEEGQLGNRRLLVALRKQIEQEAKQEQFTWHSECEVTAIATTDEGQQLSFKRLPVEQTCSPAEEMPQGGQIQQQSVDLVIDCRGTGASSTKATNQGAPLKGLRSVRGELFQLYAPDVHLTRPIRLMHPRYQLYIAPKQKGYYVVGATEIESDDDAPMTVRSAMELLSAAYSVHPGFAEANIRQHVSQCRPAFADNQPSIKVNQNLIQVNGLFRHGFLIAPIVLEQVMAVIKERVNHQRASYQNSGEPALSRQLSPRPYDHWLPIDFHENHSKTEEFIS